MHGDPDRIGAEHEPVQLDIRAGHPGPEGKRQRVELRGHDLAIRPVHGEADLDTESLHRISEVFRNVPHGKGVGDIHNRLSSVPPECADRMGEVERFHRLLPRVLVCGEPAADGGLRFFTQLVLQFRLVERLPVEQPVIPVVPHHEVLPHLRVLRETGEPPVVPRGIALREIEYPFRGVIGPVVEPGFVEIFPYGPLDVVGLTVADVHEPLVVEFLVQRKCPRKTEIMHLIRIVEVGPEAIVFKFGFSANNPTLVLSETDIRSRCRRRVAEIPEQVEERRLLPVRSEGPVLFQFDVGEDILDILKEDGRAEPRRYAVDGVPVIRLPPRRVPPRKAYSRQRTVDRLDGNRLRATENRVENLFRLLVPFLPAQCLRREKYGKRVVPSPQERKHVLRRYNRKHEPVQREKAQSGIKQVRFPVNLQAPQVERKVILIFIAVEEGELVKHVFER